LLTKLLRVGLRSLSGGTPKLMREVIRAELVYRLNTFSDQEKELAP